MPYLCQSMQLAFMYTSALIPAKEKKVETSSESHLISKTELHTLECWSDGDCSLAELPSALHFGWSDAYCASAPLFYHLLYASPAGKDFPYMDANLATMTEREMEIM